MGPLLGRDAELHQVRVALAQARSNVATGVLISGASGIGKTAFLEATLAEAVSDGWLVGRTQCHRIQSGLPFVSARRLGQSALEALSDQRERYAGGLEEALQDRTLVGEALFRFLEGLLHDYPVLLAIDDVQWIDTESRSLLEQLLQTFADRAIVLLGMEVPGNGPPERMRFDHAFSLGPLSPEASAAVVREHYPAASGIVVDTIVQHALGRPIDLVSLAQSARDLGAGDAGGVEASVRTMVARDLHALDPQIREFLQLCALIPEPIEYRILAQLWPDADQLQSLIAAASGKYLVQEGADLRFNHSAIAQSVRQTMPVEIPFRRRILASLAKVPRPSLDDYERMIQQAAACGDTELERKYVLDLARQATREAAHVTAGNAFERALTLAAPEPQDLVRFYLDYAAVLTVQGKMAQTKGLMQVALDEAAALGVTQGVGGLAATLLISLWGTKGTYAALEAYPALETRFAASDDRLQLLSVAVWLYSCVVNREGFNRTKTAMLEVAHDWPPEIAMRLSNAEAFLRLREGNAPEASLLIDVAGAHSSAVASGNRRSIEVARSIIHFLRFGLRDAETEAPAARMRRAADIERTPVLEGLKAIGAIARGNLNDAADTLRDALGRTIERTGRQQLLSVCAALETLTTERSIHEQAIDEELHFFASGEVVEAHASMAAWRAARLAGDDPSQAKRYIERVLTFVARPCGPECFFFPVALSLAAARLRDRALLERLSEGTAFWSDRAPWNVAQRALAMGCAQQALKRGSGESVLAEAATLFDELQSPLFAAWARACVDAPNAEAVAYLETAGVRNVIDQFSATQVPKIERRRKAVAAKPSRRELEIIELVAEGSSNREIAERLFLSERTVEAHLSNIFHKLDVSKRTQVAAWHIKAGRFESSQTNSRPAGADRR